MNNSNKIVRIRRGHNPMNGDQLVEETRKEKLAKPNRGLGAIGEDQEEEEIISEELRCWVCHKRPIAYQPIDCDCAIYCRTCAMKLATSFVCKKCKQMSTGMRRIRR